MEIPLTFPLDTDGFLRRECPTCERELKWHNGRTDDAPEDFVYPQVHWCPLCGIPAALTAWWTQPQVEYQKEMMHAATPQLVEDELKRALRGSKLKLKSTPGRRPDEPDPLVEPDDMVMISPPCHPWEPVKVPETASAPFYCLICGEAFAT